MPRPDRWRPYGICNILAQPRGRTAVRNRECVVTVVLDRLAHLCSAGLCLVTSGIPHEPNGP